MQQSIEKSAKVMINCAGGCWNGQFITLTFPKL